MKQQTPPRGPPSSMCMPNWRWEAGVCVVALLRAQYRFCDVRVLIPRAGRSD